MRLRSSLSRLGSAAQPALAVAILGGAVILLATIGGRVADSNTAAAERTQPPAETAPAETPLPTPDATAEPTPTPSPEATVEPTAELTPEPTPRPTAMPTLKPTPKPTPKPVVGTEPEPTPRLYTARGSFGQTVSIRGVSVWIEPTAAEPGSTICASSDPERQYPRHIVSFHLRITWPDPAEADWPWVKVGKKDWGATNYDNGPHPYTSGVTYLVSTCNQDGDSDEVLVAVSSRMNMDSEYRWYFN